MLNDWIVAEEKVRPSNWSIYCLFLYREKKKKVPLALESSSQSSVLQPVVALPPPHTPPGLTPDPCREKPWAWGPAAHVQQALQVTQKTSCLASWPWGCDVGLVTARQRLGETEISKRKGTQSGNKVGVWGAGIQTVSNDASELWIPWRRNSPLCPTTSPSTTCVCVCEWMNAGLEWVPKCDSGASMWHQRKRYIWNVWLRTEAEIHLQQENITKGWRAVACLKTEQNSFIQSQFYSPFPALGWALVLGISSLPSLLSCTSVWPWMIYSNFPKLLTELTNVKHLVSGTFPLLRKYFVVFLVTILFHGEKKKVTKYY